MSYLQEAQLAAAHVEAVAQVERSAQRVKALPARVALSLLFALALLHGALYAAFLPPWGLIDEAQHLHYIQYIAEEQRMPVAGELYLSEEIIASQFATRRWEVFHWTPPPAPDPAVMGLEGHSYEAYQPPLFYLLMTPFYLALPDAMLAKVYGLRAVVLLLSLIPVWAAFRTTRLLMPDTPLLPFWVGLLLVAIPERTFATSRINNDVLLEVVAALFFMVLIHALVGGMTRRRALLLGLLLGLGVWVKVSAGVLGVTLLLYLWLHYRKAANGQRASWQPVGWIALTAAPFGVALAARNLWIYGDLTGFGAFDALHRLALPDTSLQGIVRTVISLPNHFWLVWWKGSEVGQNLLLTLFYALMALVVGVAWARLWGELRKQPRHSTAVGAALLCAVTILAYSAALLLSYYEGMVPVLQGRFLLPAVVPFVLLLVWGLSLMRHGARLLLATIVLLWGMGLLSLFGNLIPYYYYWSGVLQGTLPPLAEMGGGEALAMIYQRVLLDKPAIFAPLLPVLPLLYGGALLVAFVVALRITFSASSSSPNL